MAANIEYGFPRFEGETDKEYYARLDAALSGDDFDDGPERDELDAIDDEVRIDDFDELYSDGDFDEVWDWSDNDAFLDDLEECA